jgi:hypothetical protein
LRAEQEAQCMPPMVNVAVFTAHYPEGTTMNRASHGFIIPMPQLN